MQVTTELRPLFSYSIIPIIIIIICIIGLLFFKKYLNKRKIRKEIFIPTQKNLLSIKRKYLMQIQKLATDINNKNISNRKAFQTLSSLIRNFIFEATNIKVQNYTLKEIRLVNLPILSELVSEYYDPEFSKISGGNINLSLEKTKAVIERWN